MDLVCARETGFVNQEYDLSGINVLIVERLAPMRKVLRDVLNQFGVKQVFAASNIEAGYATLREEDVDLVLTDWSPELDGIQLLRKIRRAPDSPNPYLPVILVTANTETRHVYQALDEGMTEYLSKPVSARLIYLRIRSIIERQRFFIRSQDFFGPDRRRRRAGIEGTDRRHHKNMAGDCRRKQEIPFDDGERRQGYPGYVEPERRTAGRA